MLTLNHTYQDKEILQEWLKKHSFASQKNCLVQFFCGIPQEDEMKNISSLLTKNLPNAHIIGTTTDGEISSSEVSVNKIIISVSIFEHTTIESAHSIYEDDSYSMGEVLASQLDAKDTKVMILFTTGLLINGEQFLQGIKHTSNSEFVVAGGMAGDNANFNQTFVSHNNNIISNGAVGIILKSTKLKVKNTYQFSWSSVGLPMQVTKSELNRVYTIDNIPAIDIYTKYLSKKVSDKLPQIGMEFPLIIERGKNKIARACINKYDDGSLLFAGDITQGDTIHFGIGNSELLLANLEETANIFQNDFTPQSIFIYSCMARRRLLQRQSSLEFKSLAKQSTISGFFSYGEFYGDSLNNYLLNQTMTLLALSESDEKATKLISVDAYQDNRDNTMLNALAHMTDVIAIEFKDKLSLEVQRRRDIDKQLIQHSKLVQMGEMISMIAHQWRQPLNAISATSINLSLLSNMNKLEADKVEKSSQFMQEQCQKMSSTIDTFLNFVKPSKESKIFLLSHAVESVMQIMQAQLTNKNIKVTIEVKEKNISINGHEDLLEQVIINLLANARDAFEELRVKNKFVNITIFLKDNLPTISIEDNAGGIPDNIREKIFNPYFTTKEHGKGTGIGLYMSMDIMKKSFEGNLTHKSTDNGSYFEATCKGGGFRCIA